MSPSPTDPPSRPAGLPARTALLVAALLGIVVVGSAYLKARHLGHNAAVASCQRADFELPRAAFSRSWAESDSACPDDATRSLFLAAMADYVHGRDEAAQRGLLRAVERAPEWAGARFYLGVAGLHLGYPMTASQNLRRALDDGFELPDRTGRWWLGVAELYCGHREEGRALLRDVATGASPLAASAREILEGLRDTPTEDG